MNLKEKLFLLFSLVFSLVLNGQQNNSFIIEIPDPNFKNALLNFPVVDTTGNGLGDSVADINGDGEIQITEAKLVEGLIVSYYNITSLEGIQFFSNLKTLKSRSNFSTSVNLSGNHELKWLHLSSNPLESLDVSQNPLLEKIWVYQNQITTLDVSQNPNLTSIRVYDNPISDLNIKNGNNKLISNFLAYNTPLLNCIEVDDIDFAKNNPNWIKDNHTFYDEDCFLGMDKFQFNNKVVIYPNPTKEELFLETKFDYNLIEIFDITGKKINSYKNTTGKLIVKDFTEGIYFLKIYFISRFIIKSFLKE